MLVEEEGRRNDGGRGESVAVKTAKQYSSILSCKS